MADPLTIEDIELILEALGYKKQAIVDYQEYPSYDFKQSQLLRVETVIEKVRAMRGTVRPRQPS